MKKGNNFDTKTNHQGGLIVDARLLIDIWTREQPSGKHQFKVVFHTQKTDHFPSYYLQPLSTV